VKVVHQGLKQYVCDSCGKKYASKIDLNNHLKKVHDKVSFSHTLYLGLKYNRTFTEHVGSQSGTCGCYYAPTYLCLIIFSKNYDTNYF